MKLSSDITLCCAGGPGRLYGECSELPIPSAPLHPHCGWIAPKVTPAAAGLRLWVWGASEFTAHPLAGLYLIFQHIGYPLAGQTIRHHVLVCCPTLWQPTIRVGALWVQRSFKIAADQYCMAREAKYATGRPPRVNKIAMSSRIVLVCGRTIVKSHSWVCFFWYTKYVDGWNLTHKVPAFFPCSLCPLRITLLFSVKAVTEFIIVSGMMVGLIFVMQCVQGAGEAGSARGVLVFYTPSSLPVSTYLQSWGLFAHLLRSTISNVVLNKLGNKMWRLLGMICLCKCRKPSHSVLCPHRHCVFCHVSHQQVSTGLWKITWILKKPLI